MKNLKFYIFISVFVGALSLPFFNALKAAAQVPADPVTWLESSPLARELQHVDSDTLAKYQAICNQVLREQPPLATDKLTALKLISEKIVSPIRKVMEFARVTPRRDGFVRATQIADITLLSKEQATLATQIEAIINDLITWNALEVRTDRCMEAVDIILKTHAVVECPGVPVVWVAKGRYAAIIRIYTEIFGSLDNYKAIRDSKLPTANASLRAKFDELCSML